MKPAIRFLLQTLLLCLSSWIFLAHADKLGGVQDFTVEAKVSADKQMPILVLFMSPSCPYCDVVLEEFLLPMQRNHEYDNKVILRQIDIGSKDKLIDFNGKTTTQSAFARAHKAWAVPTVMLFDSNGRVLTSIVGLLTVDFYLAYLDRAISESQDKIKVTAHR